MGHRVVQTDSALWVDIRRGIYQPAAPFAGPITETEIEQLFQSSNAVACRWFSESGRSAHSTPSSLSIYLASGPYDLKSVKGDARRKTRRGLERVNVRKSDLSEDVERLAYPIYVENLLRVGAMRSQKRIERKWRIWARAIRESRCVDFWTAWNGRILLAFMVAVRTPWGTQFVLHRSAQSGLSLYPNNALYYQATKEALDSGSSVVSTGLSAFSGERDGLHDFKSGMGFQVVPLAEDIAWRPFLRPVGAFLRTNYLHRLYSVSRRVRQLTGTS